MVLRLFFCPFQKVYIALVKVANLLLNYPLSYQHLDPY